MTGIPRLYAIADASFGDPVRLAQALFEGGARLVQVRNKNAGTREFLDQVERILVVAPPDSRVIVNDRVDIALIAGASGVHLGQPDLPVSAARQLLPAGRIVGFSTHNAAQAMEADGWPVDYIAVGPIFPTSSKQNPDPVVGVAELQKICRTVRKPVVAIGGITLQTAPSVYASGAASVAVIRDLLQCADIAGRTRAWLKLE